MDAFDKFIIGDVGDIEWCFENRHFVKRLDDNRITRKYIVDTIFNEEPLRYEPSGKDMYEVVYPAPSNKDYSELKVVIACKGNRIDLVTIMPLGKTNRQKNKYKSDSYKKVEKKRIQAMQKRKKYF
ncbi:hypothetical protein [uncultured Methanosphaera sp.]|uniref:hypothetical protein n=1 Tax=uncultured Methanosphaera sp. TaxID=262501 RepID=UPI000DC60574|nr:hypothetical protein [uncultured Methanosphaera sp.]RAP45694.1 MAG: hypothetical protein BZ134_00590 [Methanosphaera sp. SHI1033]